MRNKEVGFPKKRMDGKPRARARYSSKRADGTTNTNPQERMKNSSLR